MKYCPQFPSQVFKEMEGKLMVSDSCVCCGTRSQWSSVLRATTRPHVSAAMLLTSPLNGGPQSQTREWPQEHGCMGAPLSIKPAGLTSCVPTCWASSMARDTSQSQAIAVENT